LLDLYTYFVIGLLLDLYTYFVIGLLLDLYTYFVIGLLLDLYTYFVIGHKISPTLSLYSPFLEPHMIVNDMYQYD
jgi:hypothetical protein